MSVKTHVGSLASYDKGSIKVNDDLRHYAFSNIFEVANNSKPYERVMVVSNLEYCAEVVRAEGTSPWYVAPHDEFAIVMDGEIEFTFYQVGDDQKPTHKAGAARLNGEPTGKRMGRVRARRGHEVLLPAGSAYQLSAAKPSVAIIQTSAGPESVERWSEICVLK
ncbi:MAG: hypothetical protein LBE59_11320 [Nevskiaceae bacterium]|jgi:hypothetical protein|nr:hypothetical protein [Nevskiaceae bacterium]